MVEDPGLDQAMEQLAQQIRDGGKEVFKVEHNIIYAENGYIVGIYEAFIKILIEMKQMMLNQLPFTHIQSYYSTYNHKKIGEHN